MWSWDFGVWEQNDFGFYDKDVRISVNIAVATFHVLAPIIIISWFSSPRRCTLEKYALSP